MQVSKRLVVPALFFYGFLVYLLFFKVFVSLAYAGATRSLSVTDPLVGIGMSVLGGLYLVVTLSGLRSAHNRKPGSSMIFQAGCLAILAALLTFATVAVLYSLYFVFGSGTQSASPLHAFLTACIGFGGAVFSIWFIYSIPFSFVFGAVAGTLLSLLQREPQQEHTERNPSDS